MVDAHRGPEPGPWELMRGIESLDKKLDTIHQSTVSAKVFEIYQASVERRISDILTALSEERAARIEADNTEGNRRKEAVNAVDGKIADDVKFRRQVVSGIGFALLAGFISLVIGLVGVTTT